MTISDERLTPAKVTMFVRHPVPGWHSIEEMFDTVRRYLPSDIAVEVVTLPYPSRGFLPRLRNMWHAWRQRGDVNHVTGDIHYIALALPRSRTVLTVHDLVGLLTRSGPRRWLLEIFWYRLPVWWVDAVTTVSEFTRSELIALIPRAERKVVVIENAVSPAFLEVSRATDRPSGPVLCVGTTDNKNLERSIQALSGTEMKLRVVGRLTDRQTYCLERSAIDFEVFVDLPREDLVELYRSSSMLLFPSLYEGFGMPAIEAQAVGIPVITSDREPMRSIAGNGAILVNPESVGDIRHAVNRLQADRAIRHNVIDRGWTNQQRYQPSGCAQRYAAVYRQSGLARKRTFLGQSR